MSLFAKNDRWLTMSITILSLVGILYFSWSAWQESQDDPAQKNPFEYDIQTYEKSGQKLVSYQQTIFFNVSLMNLYALAVDLKDRIYVTGDRVLRLYSPQGALLAEFPTDRPVSSLAVDTGGDIYLAAGEYVQVVDSTATLKAQWHDLGVDAILTSIAVGDHDVYVADAGQKVVYRFNKSGELLNRIGEKNVEREIPGFIIPSAYFDVAIDGDGYLWAANTGRHQLENYTPEGDLRAFFQKSLMTIDGFSGCCNPTNFALLPDGSFVTSEKGIPRIKIINVLGELKTVVATADQFDQGTNDLDLAVDSQERIIVLDPNRKQVRIFQKKENG